MGSGLIAGCTLAWLTALAVYDLTRRRLPNALTLPGAVLVLAVACVVGRGPSAAIGAGTLAALYLVVHLASPRAMGAGDVKLALGIGGLTGACGFDAWVVAAIGAPLSTGVWAIAVAARRSDSTVPHGLSMCITAAVVSVPAFF